MTYQKELEEAEKELKILCKRDKSYEVSEHNKLIEKIRRLHIKINQEKQKDRS